MNGTEIITLLSSNFPTVMNSIVSAVTGALFTAIFLRHDTAVKEFEEIKAGHFKEVAEKLLKSASTKRFCVDKNRRNLYNQPGTLHMGINDSSYP